MLSESRSLDGAFALVLAVDDEPDVALSRTRCASVGSGGRGSCLVADLDEMLLRRELAIGRLTGRVVSDGDAVEELFTLRGP